MPLSWNEKRRSYTVKKGYRFPVPSRDVTNQTLPARESLVSDFLAGVGKIANHFLQCTVFSTFVAGVNQSFCVTFKSHSQRNSFFKER
jgi:hypothetical protein